MKNFLSSLKACYIFFFLLALIFGLGSHLANFDSYDQVLDRMTTTDVWHSLPAIFSKPLLVLWIAILALVGVGLFLNTWFCTKIQLKQFMGLKAKTAGKAEGRIRGMAYIHIVALVVIACHALDICLVQRHLPEKIALGETVEMGDYRVRVDRISFVSPKSIIQEDAQGRKTRSFRIAHEDFSLEHNFAVITIEEGGKTLAQEPIRMFEPVRIGGTFFFLDGFYIPYDSKEIGIELHHSYNPLALPFFLLYTVLFSLLLIQFFITRYRGQRRKDA